MKPVIIAAVVAAALTFGTTMAFAQAGAGQPSPTGSNTYGTSGAAAHIGDGSDPNYLKTQQELTTEPGYSVGTGSVEKNATKQNNSK